MANPDAKPIFHSDRGFQYTSKTFKKKLEKQEMTQSMSRVGHCIDNGPTEGFWGIIKKTGCWMVIASAFSVDELLLHSAKSLGITYPGNLYLGVFVTVWYSLNEVLSIIENADRMGVPIPQKLKTYISILKKEINDKDSLPAIHLV